MTDNGPLADCDKTLMNPDEPIYGDLITEIDLVEEAVEDKGKESLTDLVGQNNDPALENADLPTQPEPFVTSDVLAQDDAVSEFFTVDSKPDEFDNDMLISELDGEGIDFKNETDVAECHHEYESKKLLFGDCEDIVEVVNSEVEQQEVVTEPEAPPVGEKLEEASQEEDDPCLAIAAEESLNRMHVMEDVEEGCDVSGALPSSPGHAEQRPDPPKTAPELTTPVETNTEPETALPDQNQPTENGLPEEVTQVNGNSPASVHKADEPTAKDETQEAPPEPACEEKKAEKPEVENVEVKTSSPAAEVVKESTVTKREEEDSASSDSSRESSQSNKRKCEDDDATASPTKKLRTQIQQQYVNHDRMLNEYIEASSCGSIEDLQVHTEQLLAEIRTLNELAREKEKEWNNILHVKKVKEELLLRMQRKKQILLMNSGIGDKNDMDWELSAGEQQDSISDRGGKESTTKQTLLGNSNPMMVPVVSSSPAGSVGSRSSSKDVLTTRQSDKIYASKPRSILPKSTTTAMAAAAAATALGDLNGQGECRQGRQGPILDVRSIIADYRQRHPETVPRRGRRLRSVLNTTHNDAGKVGSAGNVLSMASLALGSGSQVRHGTATDVSSELGLLLSTMDSVRQENSRPSSADSSMTSVLGGASETAMSFKDVLVQFARLSQSERQELQAQAAASLAAAASASASASGKPPPPPYPEVTLHPVPPVAASPVVSTTQNNSLLHGILTKTQPRGESKPTTFSPTLARLLTAPERVSSNSAQAMYTAALNSGVSISDLLSTGKSRNEITITPVGQYGQNMKHKDGEHVDEDEAEDSADRLVIDEGNEVGTGDRNRTDNGSEAGDEVPQCQGCHQKSAQFVCAGCGNQWYCSRDCQVAAWDEHSEVCSG